MLATSIVDLLIPLWVILALLAVLGVLTLLGRIQNGRYLRPLFQLLSKVPLFRRWLQKASEAAMERTNPELASAVRKMQRTGALKDPQRAQAAMSQLTGAERRALLEIQEDQGVITPEATNRQMRRRLEKQRKRR